MEDHREMFSVTLMSTALEVSRSGYYAWRGRPPSAREMANQELVEDIKAVHKDSREVYGSPRVYWELKARGVLCSRNRVARLMRLNHIQGKHRRRYKVTTKANGAHPVAPNLLKRDFTATRPNEKWLADISYIPTYEGWLYLAVLLDLYARRVVGWAMSSRMSVQLPLDALHMAIQRRHPGPGLIHHSDRGSQYTSVEYQRMLKRYGIQASMSSTGNCYDNAPVESFFGTLKGECVDHQQYQSRAEAKVSIFDYIEIFYNRQRLHSTLGYVSPLAYEQAAYQQHEPSLTLCLQN